MNFSNIIIKKEKEAVVEYSEMDKLRFMYEKAHPRGFVDSTVNVDKISVSPMFSKQKISKAGNEYTSNACILNLFIDDEEMQIGFNVENFTDYNIENDTLVVRGENPICKLLQAFTGDTENNKFTIKFGSFKEEVEKIRGAKIKIYEYDSNGFTNYSMDCYEFEV